MNVSSQLKEKHAGAPVVDFAANAATDRPRRRARVGKRPDHPDADLIEYCIEYGMQVTASRVAFDIDPTEAEFAAYADNLAQSRANRALVAALDISPVTLDGLRAKASLVDIALQDWDSFETVMIDELRKKFLISLAADVTRFQQSAMDAKTSHIAIPEPRR